MANSDLLSAALKYADLGLWIFPLRKILTLPDGSKACTCKAGAGCPSIGKHPAIKWATQASCDPQVVRSWRWATFGGIGLACGPSKVVLFDADGPEGVKTLARLTGGARLATARAKTARGWHVLFAVPAGESAPTSSDPVTKLDVRSTGGFAVLPPSLHASGHVYSWEVAPWGCPAWPVDCPPALLEYARAKKGRPAGTSGRQGVKVVNMGRPPEGEAGGVTLPAWLECATPDFGERLERALNEPDWAEVARALACIPANCSMDEWVRVGMALHQASNGSLQGLDVWDKWSATTKPRPNGEAGGEYREGECASSWSRWTIREDGVGLGSLFVIAAQHGYRREVMLNDPERDLRHEIRPPDDVRAPGADISKEAEVVSVPQSAAEAGPHGQSAGLNGHAHAEFFAQFNSESDNPLIRLNKEYAVIGNVGSKCLVLSWENSPIGQNVKVPAFQSFKSFSERFANQYITVTKTKRYKGGEEEQVEAAEQLGAHWLKWPGRRTYRAMELQPNEPQELPNGNFNLWQGWGVMPSPGRWDRMRDHIGLVLADGLTSSADYILKWSAWTVQNPGLPAGVACVTRGGQGAGKGVFGRAFCRIFGAHGMQIFHSKHLVGNFNAHMRNCLFMFADEAHWAGDKQGAAALKGLITEPTRMLEQKGVDAIQWPNQVTLFMAANASWVVPAAHDERRYAVFNVSNTRAQNLGYFEPLYQELKNGGLGAMLFDLLNMDLGAWSPMPAIQTKALQAQKGLSLSPLNEWWVGLLQGHGEKWMEFGAPSQQWPATSLMEAARAAEPALQKVGDAKIAGFLRDNGAVRFRPETGSKWQLPSAREARAAFEAKFGVWEWEEWKGAGR